MVNDDYIFVDRDDASLKLIDALPTDILKSNETVVLATSKRGLSFATDIADTLKCRMDMLFSESIYSNINPSLVIAKVGETEEIVMHKALIDAFDISKDYIYTNAYQKYKEEILRNIDIYRDGKVLDGLNKKFVLLVDECVETGLTMMTAIKTVISLGAKNVFVAVPILDNIVYNALIKVCDDLFCPYKINDYISIEYYYKNLEDFTSKDIENILKSYKNRRIKEKNE